MAKERKTINVSLQSKKYLDSVNKILNEWEEESLNLSTQICETLLLVDRLKKSATFANVLAVYELIEKMMKVYHIQDEAQLNAIFANVVQIDNTKLTQLLSQLNQKTESEQKTVVIPEKPPVIETEVIQASEPIQKEPEPEVELKQPEKKEEKKEIKNTQANEEMAVTEDVEIPLDFLMNS